MQIPGHAPPAQCVAAEVNHAATSVASTLSILHRIERRVGAAPLSCRGVVIGSHQRSSSSRSFARGTASPATDVPSALLSDDERDVDADSAHAPADTGASDDPCSAVVAVAVLEAFTTACRYAQAFSASVHARGKALPCWPSRSSQPAM